MGNIPCPLQGHSQDTGRQGEVRLPQEGQCLPRLTLCQELRDVRAAWDVQPISKVTAVWIT